MAERVAPPRAALKDLGEQLSDPALKSSTRVLILISLALNRRMSVVRLLSLTGTGKGSLSNHLEKLEGSGYVVTKTSKTFGGYRTTVEITEKGLEAYDNLLRALSSFKLTESPPPGGLVPPSSSGSQP
jgi:DNA-binding MarR family transcriptional regulator